MYSGFAFRHELRKLLENNYYYYYFIAVCCGVRGRVFAIHTGVRRFEDCFLLFADYKLRSVYKS